MRDIFLLGDTRLDFFGFEGGDVGVFGRSHADFDEDSRDLRDSRSRL